MKGVVTVVWAGLFVAACFRVPYLFENLDDSLDNSKLTFEPIEKAWDAGHAAAGKYSYLLPAYNYVVLKPPSPNYYASHLLTWSFRVDIVAYNDIAYQRAFPLVGCNKTGSAINSKILRGSSYKNYFDHYIIVMIRDYCEKGVPDVSWLEDDIIGVHQVWQTATSKTAQTLAIADGITIPVALIIFGYVLKNYRLIVIPIVAAVVTFVVSMAVLSLLADTVPSIAINIQSALALALSIDYSMFLANSSKGTHTVFVSGVILLGASLSILVIAEPTIRIISTASCIAIFVAVAVNLTLIKIWCPTPTKQIIYDDDDALIGDVVTTNQPSFVEVHANKIVGGFGIVLITSIILASQVNLCGGIYCMSVKTPKLEAFEKLPFDPQPTTVLLPPDYASKDFYSHCATHVNRAYTYNEMGFMDLATPMQHSAGYMKQMTKLIDCLGPDGHILNSGMYEYYLMKQCMKWFACVCGATLFIVFVVMALAYRAPVIAFKAVLTVTSTFVISIAFMGSIFGLKVCWIVPILTMPLVVGIGMDFHVFYLDGIPSKTIAGIVQASKATRRITNGAGVILCVAFIGLLVVPIRAIQQIAVFLVTAVVADTAIIRPLVLPAAMILLGKHNWMLTTTESTVLKTETEMVPSVPEN